MKATLRIRQVQITPLEVPMRLRFEHAAAARTVSDPLIVRLTAEAPHTPVGYGETLARPYVTGETAETVLDDVVECFVPHLLEFRASTFGEALDFIEQLPGFADGRLVHAARAAVELALLDLAGRVFGKRAADAAQWLELVGFGAPGALSHARYSGIIVGQGWRGRALLRGQRCLGLRDFKLKVAIEDWPHRLEQAYAVLGGALRRGRVSLRVDANAGWSRQQTLDALPALEAHGVCAIEQPMRPQNDEQLADLARQTRCDLIADESLVTIEDAERLIDGGAVRVFNVRIAKNGGLLPALKIARRVLQAGCDVQLGCLVGETSILSAAGLAFLECCPRVRFAEGAYGEFLLRSDIVHRPIRFGWGGRLRPRAGYGLGVDVSDDRIAALASRPAVTINL